MIGKDQVLLQLHSLRHTGFDARLATQATALGLPLSYFYAIASRETNCLNILGDFVGGEAHGVGIVQIDVQHSIAKAARDSGTWKTDPDPLIVFGAQILSTNISAVRQGVPAAGDQQRLKIAASGYNCGLRNALKGATNFGDSDRLTTGHDYGRDVMTRMAIFDELLAEGN